LSQPSRVYGISPNMDVTKYEVSQSSWQ
jgi:hypothetical protein